MGSADSDFDEAFPTLFSAAFRVALRLLGQPAAAEDVAAETMARAYVHWSRIAPEARTAWVTRVGSNLALNLLRKRTVVLSEGSVGDFEDLVVTRTALVAALEALSRRQRDVVVLRYLAGASEEDVSRALGIAPGTVKTHLRRALEALRARLGADPRDPRVI